jgi:hypothetical protein
MSTQLSLFDLMPVARRPWPWLGPHPDGPERTASCQKLPGGLVARQQTEQMGDVYFYLYRADKWIGSVYKLGGSLWNLYLPGEHGVFGFGGPTLRSAAAVLLRLRAEAGKEVAHV